MMTVQGGIGLGYRQGPNWSEVAYRLSRASRSVSCYARAKYCDDQQSRREYFRRLFYKSYHKCNNKELAFKVALLGLRETLDDGVCRKCCGRGWIARENKRATCRSCLGTGLVRHEEYHRARFMGMSLKEWGKHRYLLENILDYAGRLEDRLEWYLRKR